MFYGEVKMDDENDMERFYQETSPHQFFDWLVKHDKLDDDINSNEDDHV